MKGQAKKGENSWLIFLSY